MSLLPGWNPERYIKTVLERDEKQVQTYVSVSRWSIHKEFLLFVPFGISA